MLSLESVLDEPENPQKVVEAFDIALENEARRLLKHPVYSTVDSPITATLRREIALVLNHINGLRTQQDNLLLGLTRMECSINTELIQMEQRTPRYSPDRFPEREKFQRRLQTVDQERRRLLVIHTDKLHEMHDRLLTVLNRHAQLVQ